jgi:hypothetical protein
MSGQDPNKYLAIRQQKYNEFAQNPSQKQFLEGWTNRNENLKKSIAGLQPQGKAPKSTVAQGNPQQQPQGEIMGGFSNAYKNSPQLLANATKNPYFTGIADPDFIKGSVALGQGIQNDAVTQSLNFGNQKINQQQFQTTTALEREKLAQNDRQFAISSKQEQEYKQAKAEQDAQEAQAKATQANQDKLDKLAEQIDNANIAKAKASGAEKTAIEGQLNRLTAAYKKAEGDKSNSPLGLLKNPTVQAPAPKATPPPQKAKAPPAKRVKAPISYDYGL